MAAATTELTGRPTFGELLLRHREAAGFTQEGLAERSGISVVTVSALERGVRRAPYRDTVALLVSALDLIGASRREFEAAADGGRTRSARVERKSEALRHRLPWQPTSFVGRSGEIADLEELLRKQRLVTVTGSGGIGKTRTALQVGERAAKSGQISVVFVDFAPLNDGPSVIGRVAAAVGLRLPGRDQALTELIAALNGLGLLLIFDNCEHVIEAAGAAAAALLQGCPDLTIIATSRERLRIAGEFVYRLSTLPVPTPENTLTAADGLRYAAIELFAERAKAADPHFVLTEKSAIAVADICRRLDGIPLAIELAAARTSALGLASLRTRLNEHLRILSPGSRDAPARQHTLMATIAWSFKLLAEHERVLLRRLSVFAGGWTLEAAEAVCADDALTKLSVVDILSSLVDKCLVVLTVENELARYHMLVCTREYGYEELRASGEIARVADRHLAYYHGLFRDAGKRYRRTLRQADVLLLEIELANARVALDTAHQRGRVDLQAELLVATPLWRLCGLAAEETQRIEALLTFVHEDDALVAKSWNRLAKHAGALGDDALAFEHASKAAAAARRCNDPDTLALVLGGYAFSALRLRRIAEAETALDEAEGQLLKLESEPGVIRSITTQVACWESLGFLAMVKGDLAGAAVAFERLLFFSRSIGNITGELIFTFNLADIEHARGNTLRAIDIVRAVIPKAESFPRRELLGGALRCLSTFLAAIDDFAGAEEAARAAIERFVACGQHPTMVAVAIEHLALALIFTGERELGARLAGYCDDRLRLHGYRREGNEQTTHDRLFATLEERFEPVALAKLLAQGAALAPEEAAELAVTGYLERRDVG